MKTVGSIIGVTFLSSVVVSLFVCLLSVFKACHKEIPPKPFYEACKFDVCHVKNDTMACSSLEAYALMCSESSVCISWRNSVKGLCGRRTTYCFHISAFSMHFDFTSTFSFCRLYMSRKSNLQGLWADCCDNL